MTSLFRLLTPSPRAIERDAFELVLPDGRAIDVARVRDPRARRLKLSVDERGARLTLPLRTSAATGERFAAEHAAWLGAQLQRFATEAGSGLVRDQSTHLPLRGRAVPLRWEPGRTTRLQAEGDAGELVFSLPPQARDAAIQRATRDFLKAQARTDVGRWLPRYLPALPGAPRQVRFKVMSSQWGSLAPDDSIALDLSLVLARPSAFEYVLVHELCHLIHRDHSRAFWREVEARFPAWREERRYFNAEGRRLKATLRALIGG